MKWFRYFGAKLLHLHPTTIDHEILTCDCGTVFRRKKEHQFCNVLGNEFAFYALAPHYFCQVVRSHPEAALAFGHNRAWRNTVDSNIRAAELPRQCPRESDDARFGCEIGRAHV